jgi:AcrR family transcriptional regulator
MTSARAHRKAKEDPARLAARERILRTAYDLFSRDGVQATGVDRVVAEAPVAKMTLYRNFGSKEELALAVLKLREQLWTRDWLEQEVEGRGGTPQARLLAIFDVLDEWFHRDDYEGCLFTRCLLESHDRTSPIGAASVLGLVEVQAWVSRLAKEAGIRDADGFARGWQTLMLGSIISADAGDLEAAKRAREIGACLLEREGLET